MEASKARQEDYAALNVNNNKQSVPTEVDELIGYLPRISRDQILTDLQREVADLTLLLEEEKFLRQQMTTQAACTLKESLATQQAEYEDRIRSLQNAHEEAMIQEKSKYEEERNAYRSSSDVQIARLANEKEFLEKAFTTYKAKLQAELELRWKEKEEELIERYTRDKQTALSNLRRVLNQEYEREKKHLIKHSKKEVIDTVDNNELKDLKAALETTIQERNELAQQLTNTRETLLDVQREFLSYKELFDEKVEDMENKYRRSIEELLAQKANIRKDISKKCSESFSQTTELERDRFAPAKSAKISMMGRFQDGSSGRNRMTANDSSKQARLDVAIQTLELNP